MSLKSMVDPEAFRRAVIRAMAEGAPGSAILARHLAVCADERQPPDKAADAVRQRSDAIRSLIRLSRAPRAEATPHQTTRDERGNRTWKRDELYDR